ncbi:hypothetical protein EVAR_79722_1 [Eumeta japonica]|uniref:Uncharacterized protein n=1 Tax=Eumeta variegata TaxID=151549 RepID=A0A4C1T950_EUMVA|nr:hypothetical protein EVAR_79722_1 [Eumeta japonica]
MGSRNESQHLEPNLRMGPGLKPNVYLSASSSVAETGRHLMEETVQLPSFRLFIPLPLPFRHHFIHNSTSGRPNLYPGQSFPLPVNPARRHQDR